MAGKKVSIKFDADVDDFQKRMKETNTVLESNEVSLNDVNKAIGRNKKVLSQATIGSKEHSEALKASRKLADKRFSSLRKGEGVMKKAQRQMKAFNLVIALNPVAILTTALRFLWEALSQNQKVMDTIRPYIEGMGAAFSVISDTLVNNFLPVIENIFATLGGAAKTVIKLIKGDFTGAWEAAKETGKSVANTYIGLGNAIIDTATGAGDLATEIEKQSKAAAANSTATAKLEEKTRNYQRSIAQLKEEMEQYRSISRDSSKADNERIKATQDLLRVNDEIRNKQIELIDAEIELQKRRDDISENSRKDDEVLTALLAKRAGLVKQFGQEEIRANERLNRLTDQQIKNEEKLIDLGEKKTATITTDFLAEGVEDTEEVTDDISNAMIASLERHKDKLAITNYLLGDSAALQEQINLLSQDLEKGLTSGAFAAGSAEAEAFKAKIDELNNSLLLTKASGEGSTDALLQAAGAMAQGINQATGFKAALHAVAAAQSILTGVEAVKKAVQSSLTPIDMAINIAIALGSVFAAFSQIKAMGAFAEGGIVSGKTLAMVGEYAGAGSNPEVIAPLDTLKQKLGDIGGRNTTLKVRGRILYEVEQIEDQYRATVI